MNSHKNVHEDESAHGINNLNINSIGHQQSSIHEINPGKKEIRHRRLSGARSNLSGNINNVDFSISSNNGASAKNNILGTETL